MFKKNVIHLSLLLCVSSSLNPQQPQYTFFRPQQKEKPKNNSYFCLSKKTVLISGASLVFVLVLLKKYLDYAQEQPPTTESLVLHAELQDPQPESPEYVVLRTEQEKILFVYDWIKKNKPGWEWLLSHNKLEWFVFCNEVIDAKSWTENAED